MKITSKGCAAGGIFRMEPQRSDGQPTVFTHTLAPGAFCYDFGIEGASRSVGRDSTQEATRLAWSGKLSAWSVKSGGRTGRVMGEVAVAAAPAATARTHQCGAQNRARGA